MILVTGCNGFIGSHMIKAAKGHPLLKGIVHLGAISDTICDDETRLAEANVKQTIELADAAHRADIPFVYASSASVYGNGYGPLNAYARSKAAVDAMMASRPGRWYGARFFNVYGPGEERKGDQASIVFKAVTEHRAGRTPMFFSPETRRDFVHVNDCVEVILWMLRKLPTSGIYDIGTGTNYSIETVCQISHSLNPGAPCHMVGSHIPESMKGRYQTNTRADLTKLYEADCLMKFLTLDEGMRLM